jgi:hypothetical protein
MIVNKFHSLLLAALTTTALPSAARAAEPTVGRITYMDTATRQLMLDNAYMYKVAPTVDISSIAVAERVKLGLTGKEPERVIAQITPQPLP